MLPRSVHGQGERYGFVPQHIAAARAKGVSGYIGHGTSRWPAVHVKDAASLDRLAIEQAPAGAVLNAVGDEGVPVREIADAIGRQLNLPARSLPAEEFGGMLVPLLSTDMPASSAITQELLGWKPTHPASSRTSNRAATSSDQPRTAGETTTRRTRPRRFRGNATFGLHVPYATRDPARVRSVRGGHSVLGGRPTLGSVRGCA
ncbi:MAG: hypothetical protein ACLPY3_10015 [Solirubrobacteraceae bacterium]